MNLSTIFLYIILHYICYSYGTHRSHNKNYNKIINTKSNANFWLNNNNNNNNELNIYKKYRIGNQRSTNDFWNNYQTYRQSNEDENGGHRRSVGQTSDSPPPYYLSYDSGQLTRYQAMEEKLIQQQMTADNWESNTG